MRSHRVLVMCGAQMGRGRRETHGGKSGSRPGVLRTVCAALCTALMLSAFSGCELLLPSADAVGDTVSFEGELYTRVDRRSVVPAALGDSALKAKTDDGTTVLYRIADDGEGLFLASSEKGVLGVWSRVELPEKAELEQLAISYELCYSDQEEKVIFTCSEKDTVAAVLAVLSDGEPTALPADDGDTYYLKFTLDGLDGIRYVVGCFYDNDTGEAYIYDRDEKLPRNAGQLLNGQIPYTASAEQ